MSQPIAFRPASVLFFLGGALGLGLGCGDEEKADPLDSVSGFCAEWGERACPEVILNRCNADSVEACQSAQLDACLQRIPSRLYNKPGARTCLDAVESAFDDAELSSTERDTVLRLSGDCSRVVSGPGEADDDCSSDLDCNTEEGYACILRSDQTEGTCQIPQVVGGGRSCDGEDEICEEGFYCDDKGDCLEKQGVDEECSASIPCADDLSCVAPADAGVGVCTEKLGLNAECETDADCATGICSEGADSLVCTRVLVLVAREPLCGEFR